MSDAVFAELEKINGWLSAIDNNQKEIIRLLKKLVNEPEDGNY